MRDLFLSRGSCLLQQVWTPHYVILNVVLTQDSGRATVLSYVLYFAHSV